VLEDVVGADSNTTIHKFQYALSYPTKLTTRQQHVVVVVVVVVDSNNF